MDLLKNTSDVTLIRITPNVTRTWPLFQIIIRKSWEENGESHRKERGVLFVFQGSFFVDSRPCLWLIGALGHPVEPSWVYPWFFSPSNLYVITN